MTVKVIRSDYDHYEIFLSHYDIGDFHQICKSDLEEYLDKLFLRLRKHYQILMNGYYEIDAYLDWNYGMVLNIEKEDIDYYEFSFHQIDMRIRLEKDAHFIYELEDYFDLPSFIKRKGICYAYKNNYYFLPNKKLTEFEIGFLLERGTLLYQDTEMIIECGKIIESNEMSSKSRKTVI